jgi:hypothetical protein
MDNDVITWKGCFFLCVIAKRVCRGCVKEVNQR